MPYFYFKEIPFDEKIRLNHLTFFFSLEVRAMVRKFSFPIAMDHESQISCYKSFSSAVGDIW